PCWTPGTPNLWLSNCFTVPTANSCSSPMILTWHLAVMTSCGSTTPKSLTVDQQQSTTTWSTLANAVVILSGRFPCASYPPPAEVSPVGLRLSRAVLPAGLVLIGAGDPGPAAGLHHRRSTVAHHRHRSVSHVLVVGVSAHYPADLQRTSGSHHRHRTAGYDHLGCATVHPHHQN